MPNFYFLPFDASLAASKDFLFLGTASTFSIEIEEAVAVPETVLPGQGSIPPRDDDDDDDDDDEDEDEDEDEEEEDESWDIVFYESESGEEDTDGTEASTDEGASEEVVIEIPDEPSEEVDDSNETVEEPDELDFTSPEEVEDLFDGPLLEETPTEEGALEEETFEEIPITLTPLLPSETSLPQNTPQPSAPWVLIFSGIFIGFSMLVLLRSILKTLFFLKEIRPMRLILQVLLLALSVALLWLAMQMFSPYLSGLSYPTVYAGGELHFFFDVDENDLGNKPASLNLSVSSSDQTILFEKSTVLAAMPEEKTFYIQVPSSTSAGVHTLTLNGEAHSFVVLAN